MENVNNYRTSPEAKKQGNYRENVTGSLWNDSFSCPEILQHLQEKYRSGNVHLNKQKEKKTTQSTRVTNSFLRQRVPQGLHGPERPRICIPVLSSLRVHALAVFTNLTASTRMRFFFSLQALLDRKIFIGPQDSPFCPPRPPPLLSRPVSFAPESRWMTQFRKVSEEPCASTREQIPSFCLLVRLIRRLRGALTEQR